MASVHPLAHLAGQPKDVIFTEGVKAILNRWTALRLGVENGFTDEDPIVQLTTLVNEIVNYFELKGKGADPYELSDTIGQVMEDDWNTLLEDGSGEEVARTLTQMYFEVLNDNDTTLTRVMSTPFRGPDMFNLNDYVQGAASSDEEDGPAEEREPPPPKVDADGWETVQPRRGRKG